jgi:hypothetical protein
MIALVVLITIGVIGAVGYLEATNASTPSTTTSTTTTTLPPTTTTSTTTTSTTSTSTSTTTSTLPPTTLPPPERGLVTVVVSSGSTVGQRLQPTVFFMSLAGHTNIRGVNGAVPLVKSVVFYADGFQAAAEVLALDAGLEVTDVAPMDEAPPVAGLGLAQLLLYLGGS